MATSPNFSWPEPDNTDLVKNGALAIRTAVDAIDSSLVDLKGGTAGQVLAKASATDMDFAWVAQDDSNAIQNAIVDAKGDLIGATAADTPARLAVGANDLVLTAASGESTGLKWAGAVTAWTPTFTNFTLGNGSINYAQYAKVGKIVQFELRVTLGSTSVMGTDPYFTLPFGQTSGTNTHITNMLLDAGTNAFIGISDIINNLCYLSWQRVDATAVFAVGVTATTPFTWTTNDRFYVAGSYLVA